MPLENLFSLFLAMLVVAIIPGPAVFAITTTTLVSGAKNGIFMAVGVLLADFVFIISAALGLSALVATLGEAFIVIKYICAIYLFWLGYKLFTDKSDINNDDEQTITKANKLHSNILTGLFITLSNPKAILFYLALFPAFVDINHITTFDIASIMLVATCAFGSVNLTYVYLAAKSRQKVEKLNGIGIIKKLAGSIMVGTGITIALRN